MTNQGFSVDEEVLKQITDEMREKLDALQSCMEVLSESMETLNTRWKGPANTMFRMHTAMDFLLIKNRVRRMERQICLIEGARTNYVLCESNLLSSILSLDI